MAACVKRMSRATLSRMNVRQIKLVLQRRVNRAARRALGALGLWVQRVPKAALRAPLTMDLEHVAAHRMLTRPDLVFVQIGAFDGQANDPIHHLVVAHAWRGVLVEPQQRYFERLQAAYAGVPGLTFLNVAVSGERGTRVLYTVRDGVEGLPDWAPQIASFDRATIMSHTANAPALAAALVEQPVQSVTLEDVFAAAPGPVDLLQIDVEGYDAEIVRMLDLDRWAPSIVRFEHKHLSRGDHEECVARLVDAGYRVAVEDADTLAYRP
jgi:FkbM family methyltransferase